MCLWQSAIMKSRRRSTTLRCAVLMGTVVPCSQVVFLGRLSVIETNKLTERLLMYGLLKVVFFGE